MQIVFVIRAARAGQRRGARATERVGREWGERQRADTRAVRGGRRGDRDGTRRRASEECGETPESETKMT